MYGFNGNIIYSIENQRKLVVHRASPEDSGKYTCTARNAFSTSSDEVPIDITCKFFSLF